MAFDLDQFKEARPTLWHLTHRDNLESIRRSRALLPANLLTNLDFDKPRRSQTTRSEVPILRDQDLLTEKAVEFEEGWTFRQFLIELSRRIFFWAGWHDRPIDRGRNAWKRYAETDAMIRVPFDGIAPHQIPEFSFCNSGATRMQYGKKVLRGPSTFLLAEHCSLTPTKVIEVTFSEIFKLPESCEVLEPSSKTWKALYR